MVKRKKRLKKGIVSLEKQIKLHKEKRRKVIEEGNIYLEKYYKREIEAKEETKRDKERKLKKK